MKAEGTPPRNPVWSHGRAYVWRRSRVQPYLWLCALARLGRGWSAHEVITQHRPPAHLVVLAAVIEGPPAVPRRGRQLAGALVHPDPGPPR
jgi:hypothetical protein